MLKIPQNFLLNAPNTPFPDINSALKTPNGLIAVGGELSSERLLDAYQKGIFPWYNKGEPILWYSPDPRMIITKKTLHISKSLRRIIRTKLFEIRLNSNFAQVIKQCQLAKRHHQQGTWITDEMTDAYLNLHHQNYAHSVEAYQNNKLVGGLYGIALGKVFFGESMFKKQSNASKVALVHLLQNTNYQLIDCQVETAHLKSMGAFTISRTAFIRQLTKLLI